MILDSGTLEGDGNDDRRTSDDEPYDYKNEVIMRRGVPNLVSHSDLPKLTLMKGDSFNFVRFGKVILEGSLFPLFSHRHSHAANGGNPAS